MWATSLLILPLLGCSEPCQSPYAHGETLSVQLGSSSWERIAVTEGICGPAFAAASDLNGDGQQDLMVANFRELASFGIPNGDVQILEHDGSLGSWQAEPAVTREAGLKWPNSLEVQDVDGDGDDDFLVGAGFLTCQIDPWTAPCGGVIWMENQQGSWAQHDIVPIGADLFYHHPLWGDLDGDGLEDVIAVGESALTPLGTPAHAEVHWFRALDGAGSFSETPEVLAEGLGSLPQLVDLDGDGDLDLISGEYFAAEPASYVWLEQLRAPAPGDPGEWARHVIDDAVGPTIQIHWVEDLYGDGVGRAIGSNHVNPANGDPWSPEFSVYTPRDDLREPWTRDVLSDDFDVPPGQGVAAPGIFNVGDADDDGDIDLLLSGDADPQVTFWEQVAPGEFQRHVLVEELTQAGSLLILDLDGDGRSEMTASGYDDNVLFVFRREDGSGGGD